MKYYLGIIGQPYAGKETAYQLIKKVAEELNSSYRVSIHHFSDPLNEILDILLQPRERAKQQDLSTLLRGHYGEQLLGNIIFARAKADQAHIICLDGVRRREDKIQFKKLQRSFLVFITAPPELRYTRGCLRADRPAGSLEQFQAEQKAESESKIMDIAKEADIVWDNSGTLDFLEWQIRRSLVKDMGIRKAKEEKQ